MIQGVVSYRQKKTLTCEIASLHAGLAAFGLHVPEEELEQLMPKQPMDGGDPNKGFVGDPNGKYLITGYGIHADALLPVVRMFLPCSRVVPAGLMWHFNFVAETLCHKRPFIVWITTERFWRCEHDGWYTANGDYVNTSRRVHVVLLCGYNPISPHPNAFTIMDPLVGLCNVSWSWLQDRMRMLNGMAIELEPTRNQSQKLFSIAREQEPSIIGHWI